MIAERKDERNGWEWGQKQNRQTHRPVQQDKPSPELGLAHAARDPASPLLGMDRRQSRSGDCASEIDGISSFCPPPRTIFDTHLH